MRPARGDGDVYDNEPMTPTRTAAGFAALGLADTLIAAVTALGYEEPTPVQRETIPLLLSGRDLLAQAATGTGKTAAFALPMIHRLMEALPERAPSGGRSGRRTHAGLVLVPTRELAMQVAEAMHKYARGTGHLASCRCTAARRCTQQIRALERGADIVVATPGRALDHLPAQLARPGRLQMLVLDEADEMLDMGFAEDIDAILEATPPRRARRRSSRRRCPAASGRLRRST